MLSRPRSRRADLRGQTSDVTRNTGEVMRIIALAIALLTPVLAVGPQSRDSTRRDTLPDPRLLPPEIAREVIEIFNTPSTLRATGGFEIAAEREVTSDVAVLNGPLTVAGHVVGRVVVINGDVALRPGARVDGGILVVGGTVAGKDSAAV